MMYEVALTDKARDFYKFTSPAIAKKLARCFSTLEQNPYQHPNIKALKGNLSSFYRFRVGDYRVIYIACTGSAIAPTTGNSQRS
jgi:mRNA interferase RelE/StbE